jgi:hypothetical protein
MKISSNRVGRKKIKNERTESRRVHYSVVIFPQRHGHEGKQKYCFLSKPMGERGFESLGALLLLNTPVAGCSSLVQIKGKKIKGGFFHFLLAMDI